MNQAFTLVVAQRFDTNACGRGHFCGREPIGICVLFVHTGTLLPEARYRSSALMEKYFSNFRLKPTCDSGVRYASKFIVRLYQQAFSMAKVNQGRLDGVWGMRRFSATELHAIADDYETKLLDPEINDDLKWLRRRADRIREMSISFIQKLVR